MPANRIILAYVLSRWLVAMDPVGQRRMRQRFGENVVLVAAPNEGAPEKHDRAIYLSSPLRERRRRLSPVYVPIFAADLASPGTRNWSEYVVAVTVSDEVTAQTRVVLLSGNG